MYPKKKKVEFQNHPFFQKKGEKKKEKEGHEGSQDLCGAMDEEKHVQMGCNSIIGSWSWGKHLTISFISKNYANTRCVWALSSNLIK